MSDSIPAPHHEHSPATNTAPPCAARILHRLLGILTSPPSPRSTSPPRSTTPANSPTTRPTSTRRRPADSTASPPPPSLRCRCCAARSSTSRSSAPSSPSPSATSPSRENAPTEPCHCSARGPSPPANSPPAASSAPLGVIATLVAVTAVVGVVCVGTIGHDWINATQAVKLLLALPRRDRLHGRLLLPRRVATATSRVADQRTHARARHLVLIVVLVLPQIGDTMDADNQIPGGLFKALGLGPRRRSHDPHPLHHLRTRPHLDRRSVVRQALRTLLVRDDRRERALPPLQPRLAARTDAGTTSPGSSPTPLPSSPSCAAPCDTNPPSPKEEHT